MTPLLLTLALGAGLIAFAVLGPWLLRRAAPALMRVPRLAIGVIAGGILVWLGTLLAMGPVLAWRGSGPVLLPGRAAEVCQRCLAASNPFGAGVGAGQTAIPAVLLLAAPTVLTLALVIGVAVQMVRRPQRSRAAARRVLQAAERRRIHGFDVSLVDSERRFAFTFPGRHGGIVLSTGTLRSLDRDELTAVLAHEHAHLRQRHHLISAVVASFAALLRWVPVVRAAADALPHYLEIAADNAGRRQAGTPALVSALIKLGERASPVAAHAGAAALHAAGPERVRQLVRPPAGLAGAAPATLIGASLLVLALASAAVHLPYASAALAGC